MAGKFDSPEIRENLKNTEKLGTPSDEKSFLCFSNFILGKKESEVYLSWSFDSIFCDVENGIQSFFVTKSRRIFPFI